MNISKLRILVQLIFVVITAIGLFNGLSILWILLFALLTGPIYCGWMCPFGTLQDMMGFARKKLGLKKIHLPGHHTLKYLRYLLFVMMFLNIGDFLFTLFTYDPRTGFQLFLQFRTLNLLNGLVLVLFTSAALFVDRFFCKYLCIEGAKHSIVSGGRFLKIEQPALVLTVRNVTKLAQWGLPLQKNHL